MCSFPITQTFVGKERMTEPCVGSYMINKQVGKISRGQPFRSTVKLGINVM